MTSNPEKRVSGPGPEGIHPTLRTGPLVTGPEGPSQDQGRTKDHFTDLPTWVDDLPTWVEEHLREAIAETLRKREAQRAQRAELSRRRAFGLEARHAAKLARRPPDKP